VTDSQPKPEETTPTGESAPEASAAAPTPASEPVQPAPPTAGPETTPAGAQPATASQQPAAATQPPETTAGEQPPAAPEPPTTVDEEQPPAVGKRGGAYLGTGRRKSSVARVRILPGDGRITINKREVDAYFTEPQDRNDVRAPLDLSGVTKQWDINVSVHGGGHTGQAGAVRLGIARALVKIYRQYEPTLREAGYLTRDARRVERKKPGQRKARRRFQFSKR
jgi:small subunit ribosomal protein S9